MDKDLMSSVCVKMMNLYCLFTQYWTMSKSGSMFRIKDNYDAYNIMSHLNGEYAVCIYAGEKATKFMTIDIDLGEPDVVHKVIDTMVDLGIPKDYIHVSSSGRKGYHVDIFFRNYTYNTYTEKFYWAMIERSGLDPRKVEFRPTHKQAIKLPLGIHQTTGNRCWYVDRETLEPIESFEYIFGIEPMDGEYFESLVKCITNEHLREIYNEIAQNTPTWERKKQNRDYGSLKVEQIGTRHNLQAKVAARARLDGLDYGEIVQAQMDWYAEQDKSKIETPEEGVRKDAEELAAWAIKNIAIKRVEVKKSGKAGCEPIKITKQVIPYILKAPTKTARLVLFLLAVFCEKYGEAKIAKETIAEYVGVSEMQVNKLISRMIDEGLLTKENTFRKYNKFVTLHSANVYKVPGDKKLHSPETKYLNADHYDITEWITSENLRDMYFRTITAICKTEYLERYLTKPEVAECMRRAENKDADQVDDDRRCG